MKESAVIPASTLHAHSVDSSCLEAVSEVPRGLGNVYYDPQTNTRKTHMAKVGPGWYRCGPESAAYWVHDHGARMVSHFPDEADFARCPA